MRGLGTLIEYPLTAGQLRLVNHYLSGDTIGLYIREVLNIIKRRGTYNDASLTILNGLRNDYMEHIDHKMIKYYVVIDGMNSEQPIQVFESITDAYEVSKDTHIIYARSSVQARELFIKNMKLKNE